MYKLLPFKSRKEDVVLKTHQLKMLKMDHAQPLTLIHISDLHLGFHYSYDDLIYHINLINGLQADIIVISGDLFDNIDYYPNAERLIPLLKTLNAKLGVFFSYGNHDQRIHQTARISRILAASEIQLLVNTGVTVNYDGEPLFIGGLDDIINAGGNIHQTLKNRTHEMFTLMIVHEPDYADFVSRFDIDLQLSGHSHGGQIRIPLFGAPVKPALGRKYVKGLYNVGDMKLHVSPGLGTTHLPVRLFCPPEITVLEIR
ncbi:metallophosphoesterase [Macrococcus hajekii]|uniref:Metallophosphoesterase n=1 Tax=Macrococcus hajekii TaxID=198482 RepID=A0A4R6BNR8_9STAP|nr:metallophosphoesterase [Macrococcus hajekii]TDM03337.1 metallophosphoesterase [Macrococcus hajekii]GGA97999.1 metallophosphoesterase [Macrococcus hajekii]